MKWPEVSGHNIPPEIAVIGGPPARVEDSRFWLFGLWSSPNHMQDWRHRQFLLAAEEALSATRTETPPHLDEMGDLRLGGSRAARRASMFLTYEGFHKFSKPVQQLARLIGSRSFQAIYTASPPPELVDYVISPENQARYPRPAGPRLEQITIEVLHGRIEWEDRFAGAGVPTPENFITAATALSPNSLEHFEG